MLHLGVCGIVARFQDHSTTSTHCRHRHAMHSYLWSVNFLFRSSDLRLRTSASALMSSPAAEEFRICHPRPSISQLTVPDSAFPLSIHSSRLHPMHFAFISATFYVAANSGRCCSSASVCSALVCIQCTSCFSSAAFNFAAHSCRCCNSSSTALLSLVGDIFHTVHPQSSIPRLTVPEVVLPLPLYCSRL